MSDVKEITNLETVKETAEFKSIYKDNSKAQLIEKLDGLNVGYHTSDDKSELTWRYLDAIAEQAKPEQEDIQENDEEDDTNSDNNNDVEPSEEVANDNDDSENKDDKDFIHIHNTWSFDVLEPHSATNLKVKAITAIHVLPKHDKDKILRNIEQLNIVRGNKLIVLED